MGNGSEFTFNETKFLTILGVVVGLIAIPTFHSLMKLPPVVVSEGVVATEPSKKVAPKRSLASEKSMPTSSSIDWPCDKDDLKVLTQQVRIRSAHCLGKLNGVKILNGTNGFTASIFPTLNDQFTTDFIDLAEGANKLELSALDHEGKEVHRMIDVTRAPATVLLKPAPQPK